MRRSVCVPFHYPPLSDYLILSTISYQTSPPYPSLQSGYQIVPLPLYNGSLAPDAPAGQGTQLNNQAPPAQTSTAAGIIGHTRQNAEPIAVMIQKLEPHHGLLSRWERRISHFLVCRTDARRCGKCSVVCFSIGLGKVSKFHNPLSPPPPLISIPDNLLPRRKMGSSIEI